MNKGESMVSYLAKQGVSVCGTCLGLLFVTYGFIWADWPSVGENLPICVASGEQYTPQIVSDGSDGCVIIWFDSRNGMELINVFGQRVNAQGDTLWQLGGVQLTNVPSYTWISYLVACEDDNGGAFFAWEDPRNGNFDVYVQHVDSTGSCVWMDNGVRLSMTSDDDYVMGITPDERGGCLVAWCQAGATTEVIMGQRINSMGAKVWDTAGVVVSTGTDLAALRARITSDGHAGLVACWLDGRYHPAWNQFKDIYAQRIDSLGNACWADTGVVLLGLGSAPYYSFPEMVSNGLGRFYVAWYDWRGSAFDIYAQCMNDAGQVQWTANGAAVCLNALDQTSPRIAPGDADGLFCAWRDDYASIRAQRLDANGVSLWPASGVLVASSASEAVLSNAFWASNGLYVMVYSEAIPSTSNNLVKAQALDASGNMMWTAGGEPVSTVASPKSYLNAISDTCSGVIAVWSDDRSGSYAHDIYAQRVDPGVSISEIEPVSQVISSIWCTPNPFDNSTTIKYGLNRKTHVSLYVHDISGRRVKNLLSGTQEPGVYDFTWYAQDNDGAMLSSGIYFVSLETENAARAVTKVILLR